MILCMIQTNQIDSEQFEKILRYIRSGVETGATLETGGKRFGEKGYYIQPTVFSNVQVNLNLLIASYLIKEAENVLHMELIHGKFTPIFTHQPNIPLYCY